MYVADKFLCDVGHRYVDLLIHEDSLGKEVLNRVLC